MAEAFFKKIRDIGRDNYEKKFPKFTTLFKVLFDIQKGTHEYENVITWLNAAADDAYGFAPKEYFSNKINKSEIKNGIAAQLHTFLKENGFTEEILKTNIYSFWKALHWMCCQLQEYTRDENIFAFMTAQKISDVRVAIVGQDPASDYDFTKESKRSTGFAFHGVECPSTKNIIQFSIDEMNAIPHYVTIQDITKQMEKVTFLPDTSSKYLTEAKEDGNPKTPHGTPTSSNTWKPRNVLPKLANPTSDLGGWINQNVLLMNSMLTCKEICQQSSYWKYITDFFLDHIRAINKEHLWFSVFTWAHEYPKAVKQKKPEVDKGQQAEIKGKQAADKKDKGVKGNTGKNAKDKKGKNVKDRKDNNADDEVVTSYYADNEKKHLCIKVCHPSLTKERCRAMKCRLGRGKSWPVVQPFTKANRHFYDNQVWDHIVDWSARLTESVPDMNRKEDIIMFF
ncbi:Uracil-DNA glycosylase [Orchesella cincta]|uniref:Uracil-DNA glycosylase n=1 Tax=Orchesella cincta TaxID=48709 RepID=A0A1D2MDS3_ORCCI|nr:Uracil-DNA glycosylase [Orchesella cincta]